MNFGCVFLTLVLPTTQTPPAPTAAAEPAPVAESHTEAAKLDKWTGSVAAGATYTAGNTDSRGVNASFDAERRGADDRWTAKGYWNYAAQKEADDDNATTHESRKITSRKGGATLKYDYFLSKKTYLFGVAGWETDTLARIEHRYYAGAGVGYQWREDETLKWGSEAGLTYFVEDLFPDKDPALPILAGGVDRYLAARLANNIAWAINDKTKFENSIEMFPSLEDSDDFYGKSDSKIRTNLSESMFAQLQWLYQYDNTPADGRKRNDDTITLGIGWSF